MEKQELIEIINAVIDAREPNYNPMGKLTSDQLDQFAPALSQLQGEVETVLPNRENKYSKCKYADLDAILVEARPLLKKHGFSVIPQEEDHNGIKYLRTILLHSSGQYMASFVELIIQSTQDNKRLTPVQAYGASLSYHKRYAIANLLGITVDKDPDDNDGQPIYNQNQSQTNKNNCNNTKLKENKNPLSANEIEFINGLLKGHNDIRLEILTSLKIDKFEDCPKTAFDTVVTYIETLIAEKQRKRKI